MLENVHDPHNIGAVLRTCDAVGIHNIYILYTEEKLQNRGIDIGKKSAAGAKKWLNIHYFTSLKECFAVINSKYKRVYGTVIGDQSKDLYAVDFTDSCAIVFGNEHDGISPQAQNYLTDSIVIPQFGFVKSLNISVACAISLFEVLRQRRIKGLYNREFDQGSSDDQYYESLVSLDIKIKTRGKSLEAE